MDKGLIKDYLKRTIERRFGKIIERELKVKEIEGKATAIIGPRRSGKTFFLFHEISKLNRKEVVYLDFEDITLKKIDIYDVFRVISEIFPEVSGSKARFIFLDEVQNLEDWESLVRTLLDREYKVFVTGSSSKLLSREIATSLRGRSISYLLLPFSFREFLKAKNIKPEFDELSEKGKIRYLLKEYLEWGGFPEIVLKDEKEKILKEYIDLAFFRDFIERHELKSIGVSRYIFDFFIQNFSKEFSVRAIGKKFKDSGVKFGINTLYKYIESLEDTLFIYFLRRYSPKVSQRERWPKKIYLCDTGISKAIRFSEDIGKLMENCVFLELKRLQNKNPFLQIFYWKNSHGEVDFILREGKVITKLIQVSYANSKNDLKKREIRSLIKASEELKCKNLLVITWDYEEEQDEIKFIPLWKWLLEVEK